MDKEKEEKIKRRKLREEATEKLREKERCRIEDAKEEQARANQRFLSDKFDDPDISASGSSVGVESGSGNGNSQDGGGGDYGPHPMIWICSSI